MPDEWLDYPTGRPGLPEWLAGLATQGYEVVGSPMPTIDRDGNAVLRYHVRRII